MEKKNRSKNFFFFFPKTTFKTNGKKLDQTTISDNEIRKRGSNKFCKFRKDTFCKNKLQGLNKLGFPIEEYEKINKFCKFRNDISKNKLQMK